MKNEPLNHSYYTEIIKRLLKADFVGWVTEKNKKFLKVTKGGKKHILPLEGEDIRHETYSRLIKDLTGDGKL